MSNPYRIELLPVDSQVLRDNRAGDPSRRELALLVPPDVGPRTPLPVVWMMPSHGSSQGGFLAHDPWREGLPQRLGRLTETTAMPPIIAALPDLFTRYGGSQSLDSAATGPYETHLWTELRPLLENHRPISAHGICGHSSGGYAAIVQSLRHPDILSACASHAGDMLFELSYQPDFPKAAARIRQEGGLEKLMAAFESAPKKMDGRWLTAVNVIGMAACYSPDTASPLGLALPFDLETCELKSDVWSRWLAWDPVRMIEVPGAADALRSLRLLFIDAGNRDEWNLHWGARAFVRRLKAAGVPHLHEEFDDGHMGTAYRFDRSLPLLARALSGA
jgi:enterochelin esterase family protein